MINLLNKILNKDIFRLILAIFIMELFSLLSFKFAWLSGIFFILIILGVVLFTLYKLEYGLYIALIELFIGSYGYLFYLELPGLKMPIRLGIFLVLFLVWLIKYFKWQKYLQLLKKDRLVQNFVLLMIFLVIGIVSGYLHGNSLKNIFFDVNGYFYFGLFFIFLAVFQAKKQIFNFLKILLASLIYLSAKVFITLYIFTHGFAWLTRLFYVWIRDTRVGEITWAGNGFFRIFIQSQIWSLIGIFLIAILISHFMQQPKVSGKKLPQYFTWLVILVSLQASILISFSRSFWLGGFVGALGLLSYLVASYFKQIKSLAKVIGVLLLGVILSVILMVCIVNFPIPTPSATFSADMLRDRLSTGDAAASSRWNLLPVLIEKMIEAPVLGSGFGTEVTFNTEDPRIKNEENPEGIYTTFTFEWGYLDTVIEMGVIGLFIYLLFIGQIFYSGWRTRTSLINVGLLIGLAVILVTHGFSPYLNHPLGLGYLMLCAAIFRVDL